MTDNPTPRALKKRGPDDRVWYVVARAAGPAEAEIVAGLLRSAGMPVFLVQAAGSSAIPFSVGPLGGVEVAVPEAYYTEAMALLDSDADEGLDELPPESGAWDQDDENDLPQ